MQRFTVHVEHQPDRSFRILMGNVEVARTDRTDQLWARAREGVARQLQIDEADVDIEYIFIPKPFYYRHGQAVAVNDGSGRRSVSAYVVAYAEGRFHLDTPSGIGIYPKEDITFDVPRSEITYAGREQSTDDV